MVMDKRRFNAPQGHSSVVNLEEVAPWPTDESRARVQIQGGETLAGVKALPPLSLSRYQWNAIGRMMGWLK